MSQGEPTALEGDVLPAEPPSERQSIGAYLARQRDLRGISLEELSQLTRIPLRSLARLESGSYDGVTDGFVRGFVRSVAESLGLEPEDTVARMLREPVVEDDARPRLRAPLRRAAAAGGLLLALLLAVGAVRAVVSVPTPAPVEAPEIVFRRNAVALLADAQREAAFAFPRPSPPDAEAAEALQDSELGLPEIAEPPPPAP